MGMISHSELKQGACYYYLVGEYIDNGMARENI